MRVWYTKAYSPREIDGFGRYCSLAIIGDTVVTPPETAYSMLCDMNPNSSLSLTQCFQHLNLRGNLSDEGFPELILELFVPFFRMHAVSSRAGSTTIRASGAGIYCCTIL